MEDLDKSVKHNRFGAFCLKASKTDKALEHLKKAVELCPKDVAFSNLHVNLGNALVEVGHPLEAMEHYKIAISTSPYTEDPFQKTDRVFNALEALAEAHSNIAVLYINQENLQAAKDHIEKSIELNPESEAHINLGNVLRQLHLKEEAIEHVWKQVELKAAEKGVEFQKPPQLDINNHQLPENHMEGPLHVVCVKWGTKYGPEYVNKLFRGVKKYLTEVEFDFTCFTENSEGLQEGVNWKELPENWSGWWGKASLFSDHGLEGRLLYIDLDTVITGSLNELAKYTGVFAVMGTSDIYCEKAKDGYNTSIIAWHSSFGKQIYSCLKNYYEYVLKYICRFDYWTEMNVKNADLVQNLFPGQFLDYSTYCRENLPENCRMVCFPREPKPHNCSAPWIDEFWI